jgi:hypothetical protein
MNTADALLRARLSLKSPQQGQIRVHLVRPDGRLIKTVRSVTTRRLRSDLGAAQRKLGKVRVNAKDLAAYGSLLVNGPEDIRKLSSVKARATALRSASQLGGPLGSLGRARLAELCTQGIELVSDSMHPASKKRTLLDKLRSEFGDDKTCKSLIDRAMKRVK